MQLVDSEPTTDFLASTAAATASASTSPSTNGKLIPANLTAGFGSHVQIAITGTQPDARRTVLTSISARLPLLIDDVQLLTATHVYVDLLWGAFQSGEAAIRNVGLVYHG